MKNASAQALQTTEPRITTGDREILLPIRELWMKLTEKKRANGLATLAQKIPFFLAQQTPANGNGGGELVSGRGAANVSSRAPTHARTSTRARAKKTAGRSRAAGAAV